MYNFGKHTRTNCGDSNILIVSKSCYDPRDTSPQNDIISEFTCSRLLSLLFCEQILWQHPNVSLYELYLPCVWPRIDGKFLNTHVFDCCLLPFFSAVHLAFPVAVAVQMDVWKPFYVFCFSCIAATQRNSSMCLATQTVQILLSWNLSANLPHIKLVRGFRQLLWSILTFQISHPKTLETIRFHHQHLHYCHLHLPVLIS